MSGFELESRIVAFEFHTGLRLTVIDRAGYFVDFEGNPLLPRLRHSHQRWSSCKSVFDKEACPARCRHHMMTQMEHRRTPLKATCYRGIMELAVPLRDDQQLQGILYVGQWRNSQEPVSSSIKKLAIADETLINTIETYIQCFADGLMAHAAALKTSHYSDAQQALLDWVDRHLGEKPRLGMLAKHWHLSESRCSHKVKELMGDAFQTVVAKRRVLKAQALLANSSLTLSQIALSLGYSDAYHLGRHFKALTGQTPGKYRRSMI